MRLDNSIFSGVVEFLLSTDEDRWRQILYESMGHIRQIDERPFKFGADETCVQSPGAVQRIESMVNVGYGYWVN